MTDRLAQARAEAERQFPDGESMARGQDRIIFTKGWHAADANPQPHTITRGGYEHAKRMFGISPAETRQFLRALGIEVVDIEDSDIPEHCAACGKPAEGFAMINDQRYCHPDEGPSCYMGGQR